MLYALAARFNEPDVRKVAALPWPMLMEWNAWFKIDSESQERMRAEARENAEIEAARRNMAADPFFRGRR